MRAKRGSGVAYQLVQNAPESCEVKIICDGKEVSMELMNVDDSPKPKQDAVQEQYKDSFSCACFKPKFI